MALNTEDPGADPQSRPTPRSAKEILSDAQQRLSRIDIEDHRTTDEILGYEEQGLPH